MDLHVARQAPTYGFDHCASWPIPLSFKWKNANLYWKNDQKSIKVYLWRHIGSREHFSYCERYAARSPYDEFGSKNHQNPHTKTAISWPACCKLFIFEFPGKPYRKWGHWADGVSWTKIPIRIYSIHLSYPRPLAEVGSHGNQPLQSTDPDFFHPPSLPENFSWGGGQLNQSSDPYLLNPPFLPEILIWDGVVWGWGSNWTNVWIRIYPFHSPSPVRHLRCGHLGVNWTKIPTGTPAINSS